MNTTVYEVYTVYDRKSRKHAWTKYASFAAEYNAIDAAEKHSKNLLERTKVDKRWNNGEVGLIKENYKGHIANNLPKNTVMQRVWYVRE